MFSDNCPQKSTKNFQVRFVIYYLMLLWFLASWFLVLLWFLASWFLMLLWYLGILVLVYFKKMIN